MKAGTSSSHVSFYDAKKDREFKVIHNKCDICDDRLECIDDIKTRVIDMLDEINNSYEDEYDKHEPWLLLCNYCQKEYQIPAYPLN